MECLHIHYRSAHPHYSLRTYANAVAQKRTCIRVNEEQFRSSAVELIRDMGIGANVGVCGRDLQDEPSGRRVLWHAFTVQRLRSGWVKRRTN